MSVNKVIDINKDTEVVSKEDFLATHFGNPQGKKALKIMKELWFDSVVANPGQDASYAFFREGERNVIRNIELAIADYNTRKTGDK